MAIAGKVSIVPRGAWQSTEVYTRLDLVTYNRDAYLSLKESTGIEPTNEEYFMLLIENVSNTEIENLQDQIDDIILGSTSVGNADKLGNETAEQWQTKLDNIQTTSRATLSEAGWYRVAKVTGATGNTVILKVGNVYSHSGSDEHLLLFTYSYGNAKFSTISSKATNAAPIFSKARYTVEGTNSYLEVYFSVNTKEPVNCTVLSFPDWYGNSWKALDFIATSETVEGVTVTCEYDIPSNASPVTDLDLKELIGGEIITGNILDYAKTLEVGLHYLNGIDITDVPSGNNGSFEIEVRNKGYYISVMYTPRGDNQKFINTLNYSNWKGWKELATTKDFEVRTPKNVAALSLSTTEEEINSTLDNLSTIYPDKSKYEVSVRWNINHSIFGGGLFIINGWKLDNDYETQTISYDAWNYTYSRAKVKNKGWGEWAKSVTTTDLTTALAGYLPNTGGTLIGALRMNYNNHNAYFGVTGDDGRFVLRDDTAQKTIIEVAKDGTTTFNGTATGNLPLSGGTVGTGKAFVPFGIKGNTEGTAMMQFSDDVGNVLGMFGVIGANNLVFRTNGWLTYDLLHTGNSAPVKITATAPSNTSALWYDTINKVIKYYKDGAWQQ